MHTTALGAQRRATTSHKTYDSRRDYSFAVAEYAHRYTIVSEIATLVVGDRAASVTTQTAVEVASA
jgi:hypothetical protein